MDKVRFAIVGCGHIGKRHAEMVRGNPEAELVGMADIRPANELGIDNFKVPFFHTIESLLSSGLPIDVINICTPNGLHESQSIMALEGGFHVVCEKPMALTKEGAEHIIFKALQVHKHVFAVMQNRYSPPSVWLKELVDQKRLGDLYMVEIKCYWNRDERYYKEDGWKGSADMDGGTLFTQFSHFVDIMFWLFGDIKNIQAKFNDFNHAHNTDFEDSGFVMFDFVKGGMGSLNYSTAIWDKNLESSITIIGSKGSVKVGGQYMNEVEYCHIEDYEMPVLKESNPPNDYGPYKGSAANHHYIIENVVETIRNENIATTNAMEGLKVVDIIERIYALRDEKYVSKNR